MNTGTKPLLSLADMDLDWVVEKRRLYYQTPDGEYVPSVASSIVRSDTGAELGQTRERYVPIQNSEIFRVLNQAFSDVGMGGVQYGKSLRGGKWMVMQAELDPISKFGDSIQRNIYAVSSHDASVALKFGIMDEVLSCSNQFRRFLKNATLTFRHTSQGLLEDGGRVTEAIARVLKDQELDRAYDKFHSTPVTRELVAQAINTFLGLDRKMTKEEWADLPKRRLTSVNELLTAVDGELSTKGSTVWGLWNGITYHSTHKRMVNRNEDTRLDAAYAGSTYYLTNRVFGFLVKATSN